MDKTLERSQLGKVFGAPVAGDACDCERPDFLIRLPTQATLGVEVTSIFVSNFDAKMRNLPGYSNGLVDGTTRLHRNDLGQALAGEVNLVREDGVFVDKVRAIVQVMPTPDGALDLLLHSIRNKQSNAGEYLRKCDQVDLIVADLGNLFIHSSAQEFADLVTCRLPKAELLKSSFREIFLVTRTLENRATVWPLRANLFASDCLAFEALIADLGSERSGRGVFLLLAAAMYLEGYRDIRMPADTQSEWLAWGAWEVRYEEDAMQVRDWTIPHEVRPYVAIQEIVASLPADLLDDARELRSRRSTLRASVGIFVPARA